MKEGSKISYFDSIADKWDSFENMEALQNKLNAGLGQMKIACDERILDIGCGTGNLVMALIKKLGESGKIWAVDISKKMLEVAQKKITDFQIHWIQSDAENLPFTEGFFDRVMCFSVWPHFNDKVQAALEIRRVLRRGGTMHIWHLLSRERINEIHANADESLRGDFLHSSVQTASLLENVGFKIIVALEDNERYLITARKI